MDKQNKQKQKSNKATTVEDVLLAVIKGLIANGANDRYDTRWNGYIYERYTGLKRIEDRLIDDLSRLHQKDLAAMIGYGEVGLAQSIMNELAMGVYKILQTERSNRIRTAKVKMQVDKQNAIYKAQREQQKLEERKRLQVGKKLAKTIKSSFSAKDIAALKKLTNDRIPGL